MKKWCSLFQVDSLPSSYKKLSSQPRGDNKFNNNDLGKNIGQSFQKRFLFYISGVFDRLRSDEKFVDVTLSSADQKSLKCHRVLLSAGSGYLEKILEQNPSDHPTIVLSHIKFNELKYLVEFMYSGNY